MQAKNGASKKVPLVVGVELPGRRTRFGEPVVKSFKKYRDIVTELLLESTVDGTPLLEVAPYVLIGYSLGSLVAHQVCQNLERRASRPPAGFIPLACKDPGAYYAKVTSGRKRRQK